MCDVHGDAAQHRTAQQHARGADALVDRPACQTQHAQRQNLLVALSFHPRFCILGPSPTHTSATMGAAFDFAPERPEHIQTILDGLDRYNPETTATFQDYVMAQCESQTYDCYANLALLKLYV